MVSFSQEWKLEKDNLGIKVYSRKVKGIEFSETKTITTLNVSKEKFLELIWNIENYPKWQDEFNISKIIKTNNPKDKNLYFEFNTPWPISQRDVAINMKEVTKNNITFLYLKTSNELVKEKEKIIRMPLYEGYWQIKEIENQIEVTFQILANPGGSLPSFLIEFYKATGPFNYFKNIKAELE